ncbi:MmcQ/YjbR family DNA-binding protein [Silvimonas sp. JCM 19000]
MAMTADQFRAFCAAQPGATTDIKWQTNEVYSIGGKMFAICGLNSGAVCFKVEPERFLELTDRPGVRPAPYLGRYYWIALDTPAAIPDDLLAELIQHSCFLVRRKLPAALRRTLP